VWYAVNNSSNSLYSKSNFNKKQSKIRHNYNLQTNCTVKLYKPLITLYVPPNFKLIFFKNIKTFSHYIYIYSSTYFFKVPIPNVNNLTSFDYTSRVLSFYVLYSNNYLKLYSSTLNFFFKMLIKPLFLKIKFKGKGYYIYKNYRNTLTPQFGYSHRLYLYGFLLHIKFLSKTTLIFFGLNPNHMSKSSKLIYNWRPINIFTNRGVRLSKQIIYKKSGKVSSYR